jgi:hypothetical protein
MLKKVLLLLCLTAASLQAAMFAGINDRGFDFGLGNDRLNGVLQGDFTYEWIVPNYSGWTLSLSPNIEYCVFKSSRFKLYAMCGVFGVYGRYGPSSLSLGAYPDITNGLQDIAAGVNILVLRPEALLSKNISVYANIPILQYEEGNQAGLNIWLIGGTAADPLGYIGASSPIAIGIKFYF